MKNGKFIRPNPLLSFTVSLKEYRKLEKLAFERGVSIAQIGRGYFRKATRIKLIAEEVVRLGVF